MWQLIAIPQVAIDLLPLQLPAADGINNGGYKIPVYYGQWYPEDKYSPIDLLVAGLEAQRKNLIITSLVTFFDKNREGSASESEIYITLLYKDKILVKSIAYLKQISKQENQLLNIMKCNAPLTWKWT